MRFRSEARDDVHCAFGSEVAVVAHDGAEQGEFRDLPALAERGKFGLGHTDLRFDEGPYAGGYSEK